MLEWPSMRSLSGAVSFHVLMAAPYVRFRGCIPATLALWPQLKECSWLTPLGLPGQKCKGIHVARLPAQVTSTNGSYTLFSGNPEATIWVSVMPKSQCLWFLRQHAVCRKMVWKWHLAVAASVSWRMWGPAWAPSPEQFCPTDSWQLPMLISAAGRGEGFSCVQDYTTAGGNAGCWNSITNQPLSGGAPGSQLLSASKTASPSPSMPCIPCHFPVEFHHFLLGNVLKVWLSIYYSGDSRWRRQTWNSSA